MTFTLDGLSRTHTRRLDQLLEKGITVKGGLRTKNSALVIDIDEIKSLTPVIAGFIDAKVEGDVQIRGLLTRDLPHDGDYRIPHHMSPDAYLLNRLARSLAGIRRRGHGRSRASTSDARIHA